MILRNCSGRHFLQAMKSLQYLLSSISPRFPTMLCPRYYEQTLPLCQNCAFKLSLIWESFVPEDSFWRRRGNSLCNVSSHQEPLTSTSNSSWQQFLLLLHKLKFLPEWSSIQSMHGWTSQLLFLFAGIHLIACRSLFPGQQQFLATKKNKCLAMMLQESLGAQLRTQCAIRSCLLAKVPSRMITSVLHNAWKSIAIPQCAAQAEITPVQVLSQCLRSSIDRTWTGPFTMLAASAERDSAPKLHWSFG
jgi:hypothetical protein